MPQYRPKKRAEIPRPFSVTSSPPSLQVEIELAQPVAHLPQMYVIERHSFGSEAWTVEQFRNVMGRRPNCVLVAKAYQRVIGYIVYEIAPARFDIFNMAVHRGFRHLDVGTQLIRQVQGYILNSPKRKRITAIVRERNLAAHLFLREMGFRAVESVPNYYDYCDDDGIVFLWRARKVDR